MTMTVPAGPAPMYLRLAEGVVAEVRRGRLRPGDALPGTRQVAAQLGIHRNTVLAAWRELTSQGWLEAVPGGRTTVAALPLAARSLRRAPAAAGFGFQVPPAPPLGPAWPPGTLELVGGKPDLREVPTLELARAWRAGLRHTRGRLLGYGDGRGHPRLREALAGMLAAERGLAVTPEQLMVTRGSQQALYLLARTLLRPGDRVAVEALGYPLAWWAFRAAGAQLVPIDVDEDGVRVDQIEDAAREGLRAVYVTPHHQFPTMRTLTATRRLALLDVAAEHGIAVIEDDYDNEFHYVGRPILPLAAHDVQGVVAYVGTLSKTLAPGLRIGFLAAPAAVIEAVHAWRIAVDRQGDLAMEYALALLIDDGTLPRHLRRMRRIYAARQAHFAKALKDQLADEVAFDVPAGGLALWVRSSRADPEAWSRRAAAAGVGFETGRRLHLRGRPGPWFRAGFASLNEEELDRAVAILAQTVTP